MFRRGTKVKIPTGASSSKTKKNVIKFTHTWTMENFNSCLLDKVIRSPPFGADATDGIQWCLELHPDGFIDENKGFVSIYLTLRSTSKSSVFASHRIQILGAEGKTLTKASGFEPDIYEKYDQGWGRRRFIALKDLLDKNNHYLPDGNLTLRCEVSYMVRSKEVPRPVSPLQRDSSQQGLAEDFEELWKDQSFSDVVLSMNGKQFRAHKAILSARSPIFRAMFEREPGERKISHVEIVDMTEDTLIELLRFIYTGEARYAGKMSKLLATIDKRAILASVAQASAETTEMARSQSFNSMSSFEIINDSVAASEPPEPEEIEGEGTHQEASPIEATKVLFVGSTSQHLHQSENLSKQDAAGGSEVGEIDGDSAYKAPAVNTTRLENAGKLESETKTESRETSFSFYELVFGTHR